MKVLILHWGVIAGTNLVLLNPEIDRTSDVIRKLHFVYLGANCRIVVGRVASVLCDDHQDAQRWRSHGDRVSPCKVTKWVMKMLYVKSVSPR